MENEKSCYNCNWKSSANIPADQNGDRVFCEYLRHPVNVADAVTCSYYPGAERHKKYSDRDSPIEIVERKRVKTLSIWAFIISVISLVVSIINVIRK